MIVSFLILIFYFNHKYKDQSLNNPTDNAKTEVNDSEKSITENNNDGDDSDNVNTEEFRKTLNDPIKEDEDYASDEIIVMFNDGVENTDKKNFFTYFNLEIIETDAKNNSYLVKHKIKLTSEEYEGLLQEIKESDLVELAFINKQAKDSEGQLDESKYVHTIFEEASDIFGSAVDTFTFFSKEYKVTFLHPFGWEVSEGRFIENLTGKGSISFDYTEDDIEDINLFAVNMNEGELNIDGDIDHFERVDGANVYKWFVNDKDIIKPQAAIQFANGVYSFNSNEHVSLSEFALIVDSFIRID